MTHHPDPESTGLAMEASAPGISDEPIPVPPSPQGDIPAEPSAPQPVSPGVMTDTLPKLDRPISSTWVMMAAIALICVGLVLNYNWLTLVGTLVASVISLLVVFPAVLTALQALLRQPSLLAVLGLFFAALGWLQVNGALNGLRQGNVQPNWDAVGALGEVFGALGQIFIAVLAVWIAWRQYVIEKDLTIRQNIITQQQTIDTYFQGISELVLDEEGLLEDWPQERAIAEGRTAAILSSVDGNGKAKILRFLSHSGLLTPLKRDRRLGRAILDGAGGYLEDRNYGIRVIDLRGMLAKADLSQTDLRWIDLSEANLYGANLNDCDLDRTNLARAILCRATLQKADLEEVRLFYGELESASPRSRKDPPNYRTGDYTGAVIENADFTDARNMSEAQRYYCCAWGGSRTRQTIPGGCEEIPNKLGR
jgi:uncharacterized protein YjbI with pentapeptide repeats